MIGCLVSNIKNTIFEYLYNNYGKMGKTVFPDQSGCCIVVVSCLAFQLWDHGSNPNGALRGLGFQSLIVWVFPGIIPLGFPPTSKLKLSSLSSLHCVLG